MRVVVTGAAGLLGRHVAAACQAAGHRVLGVDVGPQPPGRDRVTADLCDLGAAVQALAGAEAVVHCAAIPRPGAVPAAEIWRVNMATAYAVTEAARIVGAPIFVQASSFSVLGYPFAPVLPEPRRLPLDEAEPAAPQDIYGTTKWLAEELIEAAVRAGAFRAVSLRLPWIHTAESFARDVVPRRRLPAAAADSLVVGRCGRCRPGLCRGAELARGGPSSLLCHRRQQLFPAPQPRSRGRGLWRGRCPGARPWRARQPDLGCAGGGGTGLSAGGGLARL